MKLLNNIWLWLKWDAKYLHRDIYVGIKNLIYWFPVIWMDRNWDESYIFEVLEHKIAAQSKYINDRRYHMRSERDAEIMMTCVKLSAKVIEEFYAIEYSEYH